MCYSAVLSSSSVGVSTVSWNWWKAERMWTQRNPCPIKLYWSSLPVIILCPKLWQRIGSGREHPAFPWVCQPVLLHFPRSENPLRQENLGAWRLSSALYESKAMRWIFCASFIYFLFTWRRKKKGKWVDDDQCKVCPSSTCHLFIYFSLKM